MVMTSPPSYHPGNFLMKNMNPTNSGLTSYVRSSYVHLLKVVVSMKMHSSANYFR